MVDIRSFRKTLRVFEQFLNNQLQDCCCGVSVAQCHCLFAIEDLDQTTVSELANYLNLDKSTLSRTVDGLFNRGLIDRRFDIRDRRSYQIILTNAGREQVKQMHAVNDTFFSKIFEHVSPPDRENVIRYIEIFVGAVQKEDNRQLMKTCCSDE